MQAMHRMPTISKMTFLSRVQTTMIDITIDIETIPDQAPGALDKFLSEAFDNFKAPSTLTKEQAAAELGITDKDAIKFTSKDSMIAQWVEHFRAQKAPEAAEQAWRNTALNGSKGELAVIGFAISDEPARTFQRVDLHASSEVDLLGEFFSCIAKEISRYNSHKTAVRLVGHNIEAFDMRFMFQRAVIRQARPTLNLNMSRYSENLFDTMTAWAGHQGRISLANLCEALNIPSPKNDIDGSKVWDYVQAGRINEVAAYCARDVEATRSAFWRMTFRDQLAIAQAA